MAFYILHKHRVPSWLCGFNLQIVQLVGRFWVFFLSHTAPGFQLWFYFHLYMWVCSWGCPGGLGFAPVRARCGGGAAAWVSGVLATPGNQGSWQLGQQEVECSRSVWKPVVANTLQYTCLENPWQWSSTGHGPHGCNQLNSTKVVLRAKAQEFLPVAALPQWGLSMKMVQLLGLWGPWRCHMCRDTNCLHRRSYGPIRVFSQASWIRSPLWPVLSVAPPVQTLTGLSSLGFFSVVQCIRHIDGHPGWSPTL